MASALVKGLCSPEPSSAIAPAPVEKTMYQPKGTVETGIKPLPPPPEGAILRLRPTLRERIVPACVDDHDARRRGACLKMIEECLQFIPLCLSVDLVVSLEVDPQQVVGPVDLHSVSGVIDHRHVITPEIFFREAGDRMSEPGSRQVLSVAHSEPGSFEFLLHEPRVVDGVVEAGLLVGVFGVPDDQCPARGLRAFRGTNQENEDSKAKKTVTCSL
ncbi:MAG: hypothetical protein ABIK09_08380 [Pseudomonadota bacterium]